MERWTVVELIQKLVLLVCAAPWARCTPAVLEWQVLSNRSAVCNDFSRAGYFIDKTGDPSKWIVFLESGGLCYSTETCNKRFISPSVREEYAYGNAPGTSFLYPDFNVTVAWEGTADRSLSSRINVYMTSLSTFSDHPSFTNGVLQVEGQDILDANCELNPFCNYSKVLVPYCSSDAWLGNDERDFSYLLNDPNPQDKFISEFSPHNASLQFTFRGQVILRSIIKELLNMTHNIDDLVLAGSSAGGLGVVNNAQWILGQVLNSTDVSIITDSAWFINFRDSIYTRFNGTFSNDISVDKTSQEATTLLSIISSSPQCQYISSGSPCCLSLSCMLIADDYFPVGQIPVMTFFSLYDIYLLSDTLASNVLFGVNMTRANTTTKTGIDFISITSEYAGAMNTSVEIVTPAARSLSYATTHCFQHIYLAASTLWKEGGLFANGSAEEIGESLGSFGSIFTHKIQSGVWTSYHFAPLLTQNSTIIDWDLIDTCDPTNARNLRDALAMWKQCRHSTRLIFQDKCDSLHCTQQCPDLLEFNQLLAPEYPDWAKMVLSFIVVTVTIVSIILKVVFCLWKCLLFQKQELYQEGQLDMTNDVPDPQFPACEPEDAISVACRDLSYTIEYHHTISRSKVKDEHNDTTELHLMIGENSSSECEDSCSTTSDVNTSTSTKEAQGQSHEAPPQRRTFSETRFKGMCNCCTVKKKTILKGISLYFNPGELVGIMGPSGSGKTTFLDLLTGRRKTGKMTGDIFINGVLLKGGVRQQYTEHTGYVLQSATPYYVELTVRQNLILAAHMKLDSRMVWREKFQRVEEVLNVSGLSSVADIKVGGATGPGLSGGQKRRLTIALQLLNLPKLIFLDEPTSGLDAASSIELLHHLNKLAYGNRTVVLTIHQPRFEIFYMFHKLVLLSDGQIAYHGLPKNAYVVFVEVLQSHYLTKGLVVPLEDHNPADVIMDMLGKPQFRKVILSYYQRSDEPNHVRRAINFARVKSLDSLDIDTLSYEDLLKSASTTRAITSMLCTNRDGGVLEKTATKANIFNRIAVLETRASTRNTLTWTLYLPGIFLMYGLLLGTVYLQTRDPFLIVSAFCVYSAASGLFMFPALQNHYLKALEVYSYENADGIGKSYDLIIQGFARFTAMATVPVVACAALLYLLVIHHEFYDGIIFLQLVVVNMALNQTWIAMLIFILCTTPNYAFRLSPIISSIAGFTSGFFIPLNDIGWWYRWLFYINPHYYGFSASASLLLKNFNNDCPSGVSEVECFLDSGAFVVNYYGLDGSRFYMNIAVLFLMTLSYLLLAIISNWVHHTTFFEELKKTLTNRSKDQDIVNLLEDSRMFKTVSMEILSDESIDTDEEANVHSDEYMDDVFSPVASSVHPPPHSLTPSPEPVGQVTTEITHQWRKETHSNPQQSLEDMLPKEEVRRYSEFYEPADPDCGVLAHTGRVKLRNDFRKQRQHSLYLEDGEQHMVFQPRQFHMQHLENQLSPHSPKTSHSQYLKERRMDFETVIKATQIVLKEQTKQLLKYEEAKHRTQTLHLTSISERVRDTIARQKQKSTPDLYHMFHKPEISRAHSALPTSEATDFPTDGVEQVDATSRSPLTNKNRCKLRLHSVETHSASALLSTESRKEPVPGGKLKRSSSNDLQHGSVKSVRTGNRRSCSISARMPTDSPVPNAEAKYFSFTAEAILKQHKQVTFKQDTQRSFPGLSAFPILELSEEPVASPVHMRAHPEPHQESANEVKSSTNQQL